MIQITQEISRRITQAKSIIKNHSIAFGSIALLGLSISLIKYYHQKLVVHPNIGSRHNGGNIRGFRNPRERNLQFQDIEIQSEKNVKLRGWYIQHPQPRQIVVYFHQNAGNIGERLMFVQTFSKNTNSNILLAAYRGFSDSDGESKPYEKEIMKDSIAIFRKGVQLGDRDKLPLFVYGRSLGGAASIHALSQPQFANSSKGLILQNTFTSIYDVVSHMIPPFLFILKPLLWFITLNSYASKSKMKNLKTSILFIKGRRDELVPTRLMDELQNECLQTKVEHFSLQIPNGRHNDTWYAGGQRYFSTINEFMNHCSRG